MALKNNILKIIQNPQISSIMDKQVDAYIDQNIQLVSDYKQVLQEMQDVVGERANIGELITVGLRTLLTAKLHMDIAEVFTQHDYDKLSPLLQNDKLSPRQKFLLIHEVYRAKTGRTFDSFLAAQYRQAMQDIITQYRNLHAMIQDVADLPDGLVQVLRILVDKNYKDDIRLLIDQYHAIAHGRNTKQDATDPLFLPLDVYDIIKSAMVDGEYKHAMQMVMSLPQFQYL